MTVFLIPMPFTGRRPVDVLAATPARDAQEAMRRNEPRYFSGRACKAGHVSDRFVSNQVCCECAAGRRQEDSLRKSERKSASRQPTRCLKRGYSSNACVSCVRTEECAGSRVPNPVLRAQRAHPDHVPVSRPKALHSGMIVYKPKRPCPKCGQLAWHHANSGECGGCMERRIHAKV